MTTLLLDTHALLWVLLDPVRIPAKTLATVRAPDTTVYVSAASAWELATKHRLGKLQGAAAVVSGYREHLARLRAEELPITGHHALTAGTLQWSHRDPFDRVIVAQALLESLAVVTSDAALTEFPAIRTLW
ncbi:PIN domain nuclease, a component of toxin-antitoxin system (PIN domain) [Geodermatophilus siccatus]|uniref:PIN domain nuclease, a component of toxin-antitoxin system (PIN domain) n=1 Tax=Geodermatophilus siccatus TaxID=1137991 RepID=A0A1G9VE81_9ACTN|nr:type II toxin-antitoxin system VapC family toxin [Geodermatophilus siccatus]SDM70383.1 PIN domain nuclease, a component of toxin-antitoxin system (PIN domain) [Geodermatophilus siccatus]